MCQNRKRFQPTIVSKALLIKTKTFSTRLSLQTGSLIKLPWEDLETLVRKRSELSAKKIEEMFLKAFVGFGTSNEPSLKKCYFSLQKFRTCFQVQINDIFPLHLESSPTTYFNPYLLSSTKTRNKFYFGRGTLFQVHTQKFNDLSMYN